HGQGAALARPGRAWPEVDEAIAGHTAAKLSMGMRLARVDADGLLNLGDVATALGHVRSREELSEAIGMIARLLHADDVAVSRVIPGERCIESLTAHMGVAT